MTRETLNKSLEELEGEKWPEPAYFSTKLVERVYRLRQQPLNELEADDVRLLLSQNMGLKYMIPMAVKILAEDPFHEALYYPGDLLWALLKVDPQLWQSGVREKLLPIVGRAWQSVSGGAIIVEPGLKETIQAFIQDKASQ